MKAPAWLYEAQPKSALNARDVCALLGISNAGLSWRIKNGTFPSPDFKVLGFHHEWIKAREWYVKTIIKHFEEADHDPRVSKPTEERPALADGEAPAAHAH